MLLIKQYQAREIEFLIVQNQLMNKLSTKRGFLDFYNENLKDYASAETCFAMCNKVYKDLFGTDRYSSYGEFNTQNGNLNSLDGLARTYLLAWFKECGFDSWSSLKAIVLHYYPEVTEVKLKDLWDCKIIDREVLTKLEWVKQIIGG
jgi:hypothetical protein